MKRDIRPLSTLISFKGKRAVVTGAASGIGRAISYRFAEAGANLDLVDIDETSLKNTASLISKFEVTAETHTCDLSKMEEIDRLWSEIKDHDPDILVNDAGVYIFKDFLEMGRDLLEKTMGINTYAPLWLSQHFIKHRDGRDGAIINISSIEAVLPFASGLVHYDISKMGIIALTRALAREYGKRGIRVNAIIPGGIETEGVNKLKRETIFKMKFDTMKTGMNFSGRLPLGRMGDPDEVALAVLFLASDMASYIQGAILPVDGGFLSN